MFRSIKNKVKWWIGYNLGVYEFNWIIKAGLGNRTMHDKGMWKLLKKRLPRSQREK